MVKFFNITESSSLLSRDPDPLNSPHLMAQRAASTSPATPQCPPPSDWNEYSTFVNRLSWSDPLPSRKIPQGTIQFWGASVPNFKTSAIKAMITINTPQGNGIQLAKAMYDIINDADKIETLFCEDMFCISSGKLLASQPSGNRYYQYSYVSLGNYFGFSIDQEYVLATEKLHPSSNEFHIQWTLVPPKEAATCYREIIKTTRSQEAKKSRPAPSPKNFNGSWNFIATPNGKSVTIIYIAHLEPESKILQGFSEVGNTTVIPFTFEKLIEAAEKLILNKEKKSL